VNNTHTHTTTHAQVPMQC